MGAATFRFFRPLSQPLRTVTGDVIWRYGLKLSRDLTFDGAIHSNNTDWAGRVHALSRRLSAQQGNLDSESEVLWLSRTLGMLIDHQERPTSVGPATWNDIQGACLLHAGMWRFSKRNKESWVMQCQKGRSEKINMSNESLEVIDRFDYYLTADDVRWLAHYGHPIPTSKGFTLQYVNTHYPGWSWSQLVNTLRRAGLYSRERRPRCPHC